MSSLGTIFSGNIHQFLLALQRYLSLGGLKDVALIHFVGTKIGKGELRVGTLVEINGKSSLYVVNALYSPSPNANLSFSAWRHWGCVTEKILSNMKDGIGEAKEFDGSVVS
jgi:hypothetical protein